MNSMQVQMPLPVWWLGSPVLGADVTLKAESQILSLISVCFDILFELCNYYS